MGKPSGAGLWLSANAVTGLLLLGMPVTMSLVRTVHSCD